MLEIIKQLFTGKKLLISVPTLIGLLIGGVYSVREAEEYAGEFVDVRINKKLDTAVYFNRIRIDEQKAENDMYLKRKEDSISNYYNKKYAVSTDTTKDIKPATK